MEIKLFIPFLSFIIVIPKNIKYFSSTCFNPEETVDTKEKMEVKFHSDPAPLALKLPSLSFFEPKNELLNPGNLAFTKRM